jgi:transcriptional regulator with XRE-family HTH domain
MTIRAQKQLNDRTRVLTTAALRAADALGLSGKDLALILGVSQPTISRMKKQEFELEEGSKPFELAALFVRFFRSLDAITGGDDKVSRAWLRNENKALGGRPLDSIKKIPGLTNGLAYLDSRRAPL